MLTSSQISRNRIARPYAASVRDISDRRELSGHRAGGVHQQNGLSLQLLLACYTSKHCTLELLFPLWRITSRSDEAKRQNTNKRVIFALFQTPDKLKYLSARQSVRAGTLEFSDVRCFVIWGSQ